MLTTLHMHECEVTEPMRVDLVAILLLDMITTNRRICLCPAHMEKKKSYLAGSFTLEISKGGDFTVSKNLVKVRVGSIISY